MKSVVVKSGGLGTTQVVAIVPPGCNALTAISKTSVNSPNIVLISQESEETFSGLTSPSSSGVADGWFLSADQYFPDIPVSAGERILVTFQNQGSATLFFLEGS